MFVEIITQKMKEKKITQKKLCADLKIKETTFAGWKTGKQPRLETAIEIFRYLKISVDEMYGLKEAEYTSEEKELIEKFRKMDLKSQEMIKAAMDAAASTKSYTSDSSEVC